MTFEGGPNDWKKRWQKAEHRSGEAAILIAKTWEQTDEEEALAECDASTAMPKGGGRRERAWEQV